MSIRHAAEVLSTMHHAEAAVAATRHAAVRVWIFPDAAETTTVTKV
jgi:hypothetical protein